MPNMPLKNKEDIGLSPYEIKFRGRKKADKVLMTIFDITPEKAVETQINSVDEIRPYLDTDSIKWLNIDGLHNEELMINIAQELNISADIISDIMQPSLRPKVEEFDNGLFISIKMLRYYEKSNLASVENLSMIVRKNMLITFQEIPGDIFNPVRDRIRKHKTKIRTSGSDYLAFALLDVVIDNYIYILGVFGEMVEAAEGKIVFDPDKEKLKVINNFKHEQNNLSRDIKPAKEMIMNLVKVDTDLISKKNRTHFKELQDNINQAVELLDYYREVIYDEFNMYHSAMSAKMNDNMALLTIFSVVFIPLTFIVGLYGMNFDNMPELRHKYGYFIVLGIMFIIAVGMLLFFKRKKWF